MRSYREVTYEIPLAEPLKTQAYIADSKGDWRIVVFPGTPCQPYLFHRFLRYAPPDIEVVVITRPGFGRGHRAAFLSFEDQVAAAKPFLGDRRVATLGISYGGELALKAALDFPGDVHGVVTVAALVTEPRGYVQPLVDFGGGPVVRGLLPRRLHHARAEVAARRAQIGPLLDALKDLQAPVEVLHGDMDTLVPLSDARLLRSKLADHPRNGFELIRGGTHYLELQFPRRLHQAVERVIARTG